MKHEKLYSVLFIATAIPILFSSCTNFFSTSLASWARRDPSALIPAVMAGNVNGLVEKAANDPALSLALLKSIRDAVRGTFGTGRTVLQAAAVKAAVNAAAPASAVLNHIDEDTEINSGNAADLFNRIVSDIKNLPETAGALKEALPAAAVPGDPEFDAFTGAADPYYLAMAAMVIFADDAVRSGNSAAYISGYTFPGRSSLVEALVQAAQDKGGDKLGIVGDLLDNLHLTS
ncbi:MAG: hypothetical protein LBG42_00690 [Treponema sp.]|jgi:hypothetical protein|nr:hypothetical protein [Treponema sp.]